MITTVGTMLTTTLSLVSLIIVTVNVPSVSCDDSTFPIKFQMHCRRLVSARVDPDRFPGECASHVHDAFGAATWNPEVELQHLKGQFTDDEGNIQATQTTCAHPQDRSMYWFPSLYLKARDCSNFLGEQPGDTGCGMFHQATPTKMTVYYQDFASSLGTPIVKNRDRLRIFPKNFRIRVDPADDRPMPSSIKRHFFLCKGQNPDNPKRNLAFNIPPGGDKTSWRSLIGQKGAQHCDTLMLRIPFPPCFKSSNDYDGPGSGVFTMANGLCPIGYPRRFPELQYNLEYNLTDIFEGRAYCGSWDNCLKKLVSAANDDTGNAFHAVFINGWNGSLLGLSMEHCTLRPGSASGPKCPLEEFLGKDQLQALPPPNWLGQELKPQLPGRLPIEDVESIPDLLTNANSQCNIPGL